MAEIINLHGDINDADDREGLKSFVQGMVEDNTLVKGAFIVFNKKGQAYIGITEVNKARQIALLYQLQERLKQMCDYMPDPIEDEEFEEDAE